MSLRCISHKLSHILVIHESNKPNIFSFKTLGEFLAKTPFYQALLEESKSSDKLGLLFVALELGGLQVLAIKISRGVDEVK